MVKRGYVRVLLVLFIKATPKTDPFMHRVEPYLTKPYRDHTLPDHAGANPAIPYKFFERSA